MKHFKPSNGHHALVEMAIFFNFADNLSRADMKQLEILKNDLKDEFPVYQETQGFSLEMQADNEKIVGSKQTFGPVGFELKKIGANSHPEWVINVEGKGFAIHCLDYTRWDETWQKLSKYIYQIFDRLGVISNVLHEVGIKCLDSFEFKSDVSMYAVNELFNENSSLITGDIFVKNHLRWHCHSGWFEQCDSKSNVEVLNQLNLNSGGAVRGGVKSHLTTIDHTQTIHSKPSGDIGSVIGNLGERNDFFNQIMLNLHKKNKEVMRELLSEGAQKSIGLNNA